MDIKSNSPYPSGELSNFAIHPFVFRGVSCNSMEGLLQSLKFEDAEEQKEVCLMTGKAAKQRGMTRDWRVSQILWWQGKTIDRHGKEYQQLLDEAFYELFTQNQDARKALLATENEQLIHSIGVIDSTQTILSEHEFCSRLMTLRETIKKQTTQPAFPSPTRRL